MWVSTQLRKACLMDTAYSIFVKHLVSSTQHGECEKIYSYLDLNLDTWSMYCNETPQRIPIFFEIGIRVDHSVDLQISRFIYRLKVNMIETQSWIGNNGKLFPNYREFARTNGPIQIHVLFTNTIHNTAFYRTHTRDKLSLPIHCSQIRRVGTTFPFCMRACIVSSVGMSVFVCVCSVQRALRNLCTVFCRCRSSEKLLSSTWAAQNCDT